MTYFDLFFYRGSSETTSLKIIEQMFTSTWLDTITDSLPTINLLPADEYE